ncbi:Acyl-CoA synthetase (AMP-forming)/AMP-acid ligase II [Syntrophus gentianae]|uniref:Acyl-CoA synthetase (AMP-forming)/AMP-acid ligase II n=1 Tax=Syntrophus gentianae TaxID=43775 RepID=A0A1H7VKE9_9BACT|nr:hypothetical protein [Syntrophus gentianae]SEM09277.1 Acyl-CoA synthetase (AMP-forming)/AMP-acid ligase II [Syntrophus gentianae]
MPNNLNTAFIENGLRLDAQQPCGKLEWLQASYDRPAEFWSSLKGAFDARFAVHGTSALYGRYDFYHDIIVRNRNNAAPALCWNEPVSGIRNISYGELGALAAAKAGHWVRLGVLPGQILCIVRTIGLEMIVELLAALKIGCRISFLPLRGNRFLQSRLEALQPEHISLAERHIPLLAQWSERVLSEDNAGKSIRNEREQSFSYPSGQVVFRSFDPCGYNTAVPADITSDAAYLCALRDASISLGIGPGQVFAAPGFHLLETTPALLLTGLLSGATYLHLTPQDIEAKPGLVVQMPVKTFGVSKEVRDILLEKQVEVGNAWECWFRNPAESQDLEQWQNLIRHLKLENSYAFNLRWNAALGGCSLFSLRRKGMAHMSVLPVPGSAWCLGELSGGGGVAVTDMGLYTLSVSGAPEEEQKGTADRIAKNRGEWIFAGVQTLHRNGRTFPAEEILTSLKDLATRYRFFCSLADVPLMDPGVGHRIVLLVFRGADAGVSEARILSEIRSTIVREMGEEFQPDRIEFLPLYPRFLTAAEVDHAWCRNAFLTGALSRRSRGKIFLSITRLRKCIMKA